MASGDGNSYQVGTTAAASVARRVLNSVAQYVGFAPNAWATMTTTFGANADLTYQAQKRGTVGNAITITYAVAGNSTPLTVGVAGNAITVNLSTTAGGAANATAAQVMAAVQASVAATALVRVGIAAGQNGTGVPVAMSATLLSGGLDGVVGTVGSARLPKVYGAGISIHNSYN
jgi:hypothetical protein